MTLQKIIGTGILGLALALPGCSTQVIERNYPVEDLVSNYNGWSIFYTDKLGEVKEERFSHYNGSSVKVIRDLSDNSERHAEVKEFRNKFSGDSYEVVIHIRKNDRISGGDDSSGGKNPRHYKRNSIDLEAKE
ncbi:Uncharacterised protein [uncultured archaeon]|nr:Uncharacterised protein [uncultured archaeon]